jgi:hypothetical protein
MTAARWPALSGAQTVANGAISDQTDQIRDALCARDQGRVARADE